MSNFEKRKFVQKIVETWDHCWRRCKVKMEETAASEKDQSILKGMKEREEFGGAMPSNSRLDGVTPGEYH